MVSILTSTIDPTNMVKINGLEYPKSSYSMTYSNVLTLDDANINYEELLIGLTLNSTKEQVVSPTTYDQFLDAEGNPITSYDNLISYLTSVITLNFNSGGATPQNSATEYAAWLTYDTENPTVPIVNVDKNTFGDITWEYDEENGQLVGNGDFSGRIYWNVPAFLNPSGDAPATTLVGKTDTTFSVQFLNNSWSWDSSLFENNPIQVSIWRF